MASKNLERTLRAVSKAKVPTQLFPHRTFVPALACRPASVSPARAALTGPIQQQTRGVKTIDFAGSRETVYGKSFMRSISDRVADCYRA